MLYLISFLRAYAVCFEIKKLCWALEGFDLTCHLSQPLRLGQVVFLSVLGSMAIISSPVK